MLDSSGNNKSVYSAGVFFLFHQELFTLSNVNRRSPCNGINSVHMMQCWLNFWNDRYKCHLMYYLQSKEYADMHVGTSTCAYIIIIIIALLRDKDSQHGSMSVAGSLVISKTNRRQVFSMRATETELAAGRRAKLMVLPPVLCPEFAD